MSSRPAIVLVILIISIIALCLAGVFAAITGPYHLNLNLSDNNDTKVNLTENLTPAKSNDRQDTGSQKSNVQTYSDSQSSSSPSSQSQVQTVEEPSQQQSTPSVSPDSSRGSSSGSSSSEPGGSQQSTT